jgi:predicted PurR-regulated permease PerM
MNDRFFERAGSLAVVTVLVIACLKIISPFVGALLWGIIIAVSLWPLFLRLYRRLERRGLAAFMMSVGMALVFIVPFSVLISSLTEHVASVAGLAKDLTTMKLPEAPAWLAKVPLMGSRLEALWHQASTDMPAVLESARPAIRDGAAWVLKQSGNLTLAVLEFLLAIIFAGLLLANGEAMQALVKRLTHRIGGQQGLALVDVAGQTIRAVAIGVIGTALAQALLSVFGFVIAGVPGAMLLGLLCFMLAMMHVGTSLVWIPVAIWLGYQNETGWAIFTVIWGLIINISDNIVRPYLISHGSGLPIMLIFLGVIGGLLAWGFIGIFVGATLLVVCFTLLNSWLEMEPSSGLNISRNDDR